MGEYGMNRKQIKRSVIIIGFFMFFIFAAANSVIAYPGGYTGGDANECGSPGCHTTTGVLTLASNSTNVNATTGEAFVLDLSAGNGAEWIAIVASWANNSQFAVSQRAIQDGSTNDTNSASGSISAQVRFIPLTPGNMTIKVWTAAVGGVATSLVINVEVTGQSITTTTTTQSTGFDPVSMWIQLLMIIPVSVGVILLILGITVFKKKE